MAGLFTARFYVGCYRDINATNRKFSLAPSGERQDMKRCRETFAGPWRFLGTGYRPSCKATTGWQKTEGRI